jgi:hypothetical protein
MPFEWNDGESVRRHVTGRARSLLSDFEPLRSVRLLPPRKRGGPSQFLSGAAPLQLPNLRKRALHRKEFSGAIRNNKPHPMTSD